MIFRQNTEGLYGGVEWTNPPDQVYDALMTHKKFKENFAWCPQTGTCCFHTYLHKKIYHPDRESSL